MPYRVLLGFIKKEKKNIEEYLENEDVDLDLFDINNELVKIKDHKVIYFHLTKNYILLSITKNWIITTICFQNNINSKWS